MDCVIGWADRVWQQASSVRRQALVFRFPFDELLNAAVKRPDIVKLWTEQGAVAMSMTPEEFDKYLRGDIVKWAAVVKQFADKPQ